MVETVYFILGSAVMLSIAVGSESWCAGSVDICVQVVTGRPLKMGDIAIIDFKVTRVDTDELITGSQKRGMRLDTEMGDRSLGIGGTHLPRLMLVSTCYNSGTDSKNGKERLPQSVVLSRLCNLGSWVSHLCAGMGWCFMLMGQGVNPGKEQPLAATVGFVWLEP